MLFGVIGGTLGGTQQVRTPALPPGARHFAGLPREEQMTDVITTERPANEVWADEAQSILESVAAEYGRIITYQELGERIQQQTGVTTRALVRNWIGPVLGSVLQRCQQDGKPPLTSLVVGKSDGRVGVGYDDVFLALGQPSPADSAEREQHAATSRLECYRRYSRDVPAAARPQLSPTLQNAMDKERKLRKSLEQAPRCKTCNVELSRSGICDTCDS